MSLSHEGRMVKIDSAVRQQMCLQTIAEHCHLFYPRVKHIGLIDRQDNAADKDKVTFDFHFINQRAL